MLSQVIKGYLYKYSHLTLFKMGFFILVVVSLFLPIKIFKSLMHYTPVLQTQ